VCVAQIVAEVGSIDMLANGFLVPAHDPGSLNRYADSLSVHMRSIISGLRLSGREELIIGEAVHSDIPQSSIGEYLARELVVVLTCALTQVLLKFMDLFWSSLCARVEMISALYGCHRRCLNLRRTSLRVIAH